jgi:hypothetical protein
MNESLRALSISVDELSTEVHSLRAEHRRNTSALWGAIVVCGVAVLILGGIGFHVGLDNRRSIEENNRRWCPMVGVLLPSKGDPQPTTERGRIVVDSARQLYKDFGCA